MTYRNGTPVEPDGILGSTNIIVLCRKGIPFVLDMNKKNVILPLPKDAVTDFYDFGSVRFEHEGYRFYFTSGRLSARMTEPDGTEWLWEDT